MEIYQNCFCKEFYFISEDIKFLNGIELNAISIIQVGFIPGKKNREINILFQQIKGENLNGFMMLERHLSQQNSQY